jgi:hypothetical protein
MSTPSVVILKKPTQCHLWQMENLTAQDIYSAFEGLERFLDDVHHIRSLLRCRQCGQLYFHEFYEWIDWTGGDDPQYSLYIPVETREQIEALAATNEYTILNYFPRLHKDYPSDAKEPKIFWVGK